jgi:serine/threonine protein phosphatase 1
MTWRSEAARRWAEVGSSVAARDARWTSAPDQLRVVVAACRRGRGGDPLEPAVFEPPPRRRLEFSTWPAAIYAIGDIHGCASELAELERRIVADAASLPGEKWLVPLGDYIDRGPASPAVLDQLLRPPPPGFRRVALLGNHEALLLAALRSPAACLEWLALGGMETAFAYGLREGTPASWRRAPGAVVEALWQLLPAAHVAWLESLPIALSLPGFVFVHAGLRPGLPLAEQRDDDLLWVRTSAPRLGRVGTVVVHGHTPVEEVVLDGPCINLDTGCCYTGRLSALRIIPGEPLALIEVRR